MLITQHKRSLCGKKEAHLLHSQRLLSFLPQKDICVRQQQLSSFLWISLSFSLSRLFELIMFKSLFATTVALLGATVTTAHQDVLNIHGSGTTNPSKCIWAIMEDFMDQSKHPIRMTYRAVGSGTGIAEFINGNSTAPAADFGSGDLPLPAAAYKGLDEANIAVLQLPILLSAVSVFHNVPGIEALDLDACLLAKIFGRKITSWGHAEIVARNPALAGSDLQISVARRVRGSSSTDSITNVRFISFLRFLSFLSSGDLFWNCSLALGRPVSHPQRCGWSVSNFCLSHFCSHLDDTYSTLPRPAR